MSLLITYCNRKLQMYYISLLRLAIYIYIEFFILETDHIFDAAENISTGVHKLFSLK